MIFTEIVTHSDSQKSYSQGCEKFLSHLSALWIESSAIVGLRIGDFGLREGGGLMAAEYLWEFCTGGCEKIFKSKRHRPPEPGGQRAERAGGCSIAACRNGRATACAESDSFHLRAKGQINTRPPSKFEAVTAPFPFVLSHRLRTTLSSTSAGQRPVREAHYKKLVGEANHIFPAIPNPQSPIRLSPKKPPGSKGPEGFISNN